MFKLVNGCKCAYQVDGAKGKPWVVLVHGFPFSRATWKAQVASLKQDFSILTYDLRGMGQSDLGPAPQPLEAYVDDLLALMDMLGIAKAALGGLSMGGYIVLRAAQRAPERFGALVLADTKSEADSDEGKLGRASAIKALRAKGVKPFATAMLPKLLLKPESAVGKGLLKIMLQNKVPGMTNALVAMQGRTDTTAGLKALALPTLVVVGSADQVTPPAGAQVLAKRIPGARLRVLKDAGHVSNLEAPAAFNTALVSFLKSLPVT